MKEVFIFLFYYLILFIYFLFQEIKRIINKKKIIINQYKSSLLKIKLYWKKKKKKGKIYINSNYLTKKNGRKKITSLQTKNKNSRRIDKIARRTQKGVSINASCKG